MMDFRALWMNKRRVSSVVTLTVLLGAQFACVPDNTLDDDIPAHNNQSPATNNSPNDSNQSPNNSPSNSNTSNNHNSNNTDNDAYNLNVRFEPAGEDFYRMPWPSNFRVSSDGTIDLSDIPNGHHSFVRKYRSEVERIQGYSTMPVVYVAFDADPGEQSIPTPAQSIITESPIQLIELGEGCGLRTPLDSQFDVEGDNFIDPFVLKSTPVPGFALKPETTYAYVVLKSFGSASQMVTNTPDNFVSLLTDGSEQDAFLYDVYAPLRDCLPDTGIATEDIAVATVFTTQDPVTETRLMRQVVMDPAKTAAPIISNWEFWESVSNNRPFPSWRGTFEAPDFQRGNSPYTNSGGGLVFDDAGLPEIQQWEEVPFAVTLPTPGTEPHPVLVWVDGTGARLHGHITDTHIAGALEAGFVVVTFSPQFHGDRATASSDSAMSTFNYINPEAGRTNFRQQAAETSYLIRLIKEALPYVDEMPALDTNTIYYGGHSQGAIVGAIVAGVEPTFQAYALNGIGSYMSATIIERKDYVDIAEMVQTLLNINRPIDRFHLVVQLAQLGSDVVDPQNYAPYWRGWEDNPGGSHILLSNGKQDHTTPFVGMNALSIAGDIPPLAPAGWDVDPHGVWNGAAIAPAFSANKTALDGTPLTMGHYLNPTEGHFTIYREERAAFLFINFWTSALQGAPTIRF